MGRYVRGNEQALRGFAPRGRVRRPPRSPFSGVVETTLTTGTSAILDRAAKNIDTKNLPAAFKSADELAKKYLGTGADAAKTKLLQFLYLQARSGIDAIASGKAGKVAAVATATINTVAGAYANIQEIANRVKSDQPLDASGVADVVGLSKKVVGSILDFLGQIGAVDAKVQAEIMAWANVAGNCAAGVAVNPYLGAASCAIGFASQLIDSLSKKSPYPGGPAAIFTPNAQQVIVAAADAARLAAVLRYQYGVPSYDYLYKNNLIPNDGTDPNARFLLSDNYPSIGSTSPMTGVDMRVALALLRTNGPDALGAASQLFPWSSLGPPRTGDGHPWHTTRYVLETIARGGLACTDDCGRGTYDRSILDTYINDHDVDVQAIDAGQKLYEQNPTHARSAGLDAFKRAYELVNFFAALTAQELRTKNEIIRVYTSSRVDLPVRLYAVSDSGGHDCRHDFYDYPCTAYGKKCWTSLNRCLIPTEGCKSDTAGLEAQLFSSDNLCALRQVGAIRLMAAFSYLHMAYMNGYSFGSALAERDLIATLPSESDPAIGTQLPVKIYDKAWVTTILTRMEAKAAEVKTLHAAAVAAAKLDAATAAVSPDVLAAFKQPTTTAVISSATDPFQQAVKSGQVQLQTWAQWEATCKAAGGVTVQQADGSRTCVPASSAGASSGAGGVALLGGAALLALLLLKR